MDLTLRSGKEGVLIEQYCTPSIVGHVEPIREKLVIDMCNRFLQVDDVSLPRNVLFNGSFFSASGSWVLSMNTEPLLFGRSVGHLVVEAIFLAGCGVSSGGCIAVRCMNLSNVDRVPF